MRHFWPRDPPRRMRQTHGPVSHCPWTADVGQRFSNFTLTDVTRTEPVSLYGFAGKKAVGAGFPGHRLPARQPLRPATGGTRSRAIARGVAFLGINSNAHDTERGSPSRRKHGIDFPVLKDPATSSPTSALVERTPEVVVLDGRARIRYRGAIDDQYGAGDAQSRRPATTICKDALDAVARRAAGRGGGDAGRRLPARPGRAEAAGGPPAAGSARPARDSGGLRGGREGRRRLDVGKVTYASATAPDPPGEVPVVPPPRPGRARSRC